MLQIIFGCERTASSPTRDLRAARGGREDDSSPDPTPLGFDAPSLEVAAERILDRAASALLIANSCELNALRDYQRRLSVVSHKSARSHFISGAIITLGDYHQLPNGTCTNHGTPMISYQ